MKVQIAVTLLLAAQPSNAFIGRLFGRKKAKIATKPTPKLPPTSFDNKGLEQLFQNNQAWKKSKIEQDQEFFNKLGTTHQPDYMYIGE